jgi:predicted cupin superfamily sugar epimerase
VTVVHSDALAVIDVLGLLPHPEGGFYRETFRAPTQIATRVGPRAASTAIYFLLPTGTFSTFHRVASDEAWHHYDGDPLELHTIDAAGTHEVTLLGASLALGHRPQHVVPASVWQAAIPIGDRYALCGCTVAPGFDFADFEMATRAGMIASFPRLRAPIERLTRTG